MQARVDWFLKIFGAQVTRKKQPVRPVFPDSLSLRFLWLLPMHLNILADHNFQILYSTNDLPMILLLLNKVLA